MTNRPARQTASMISPRQVRRLAKRKGISEHEAYAQLFNSAPGLPGSASPRLVVVQRPSGQRVLGGDDARD